MPAFLQDAFRRPATAAEVTRYQNLYTSLVATDTASEAMRGVLQAVLLSPSFLYRTEIGSADGKLNPYELASRLSYFVWGSKPDTALLDAAKNNALDDAATRASEVSRLIDDGRAKAGMLHIINEWIGLDEVDIAKKGSDITTGLPADIQPQLEAETSSFLTDALFGPSSTFETLYNAKHSFVSKEVAAITGCKASPATPRSESILDVTTRRGLFTQPLVLAAHTKESGYSVVQMGRFIREHALCQNIPPPPANVKTESPTCPPTQPQLPAKARHARQQWRMRFVSHLHGSTGLCLPAVRPVGRYKPLIPRGSPSHDRHAEQHR